MLVTRLQIDCRPKTANIPRGKISSGANIPLAAFPRSRYSSFLTAVADCSYQGRRSIGAKTPRDREVGAGCHSSAAAAVKYLRRCLIIAPAQLQQSTCKSKRRHKCPFPRMRFLKNKLAIIGGHHVGHYVVCEGSERLTEWKSFSFFRTPCRPPCRPPCPSPCRPPWPPTCQPSCRRFVRAQRR